MDIVSQYNCATLNMEQRHLNTMTRRHFCLDLYTVTMGQRHCVARASVIVKHFQRISIRFSINVQ